MSPPHACVRLLVSIHRRCHALAQLVPSALTNPELGGGRPASAGMLTGHDDIDENTKMLTVMVDGKLAFMAETKCLLPIGTLWPCSLPPCSPSRSPLPLTPTYHPPWLSLSLSLHPSPSLSLPLPRSPPPHVAALHTAALQIVSHTATSQMSTTRP